VTALGRAAWVVELGKMTRHRSLYTQVPHWMKSPQDSKNSDHWGSRAGGLPVSANMLMRLPWGHHARKRIKKTADLRPSPRGLESFEQTPPYHTYSVGHIWLFVRLVLSAAYSDESGHPFRRKMASGSEPIRPVIPTNPATPLAERATREWESYVRVDWVVKSSRFLRIDSPLSVSL
jgi:hypothetical protein